VRATAVANLTEISNGASRKVSMLTVLIGAHKKWLRSGSEVLYRGFNSHTIIHYNILAIK
jgi:hypothetical protein